MTEPRLMAATGRRTTRMGQAPRFAEGLYELVEHTYAWLVPNGSWGETNLGLVRCGDQSVLIDTCWDLHHMREMLGHAKPILAEAPIRHVINTHADGDHCWGNQLFADLPITATQASAAQMHQHPPGQLIALQRASPWLARIPLGNIDTLGRYMGDMLRPYRFAGVRIQPATQTFSGRSSLDIEGVRLELIEVGPAHTSGDCMVDVPERGVIYTGDILFVGVTPVAWAGPVSRIVQALQQVLAMQPQAIVPGHGPAATLKDVQLQIDYWQWLQDSLQAFAKGGHSAMEAAQACLQTSAFKRSAFAAWLAPERIYTSACTLYREWGLDTPALPGPLGALDHFRRQASLRL